MQPTAVAQKNKILTDTHDVSSSRGGVDMIAGIGEKPNLQKDFLNKIICGSAVDVMKRIPDDSVGRVVEICNHCGSTVSLGSGKFVNRVPDLNDISTRRSNGLVFVQGDFICETCDDHS